MLRASHNTQSTYMDPPWDKRVQEHYRALREHLEKESRRLQVCHRRVLRQIATYRFSNKSFSSKRR